MKVRVGQHRCEIVKSLVNERELNITEFEFEFDTIITNDFVKEAYFTYNGETYKQIIVNDKCSIPSEVLEEKGQIELGVVAYLVENNTEIKRYNPSPVYFNTLSGSLKDNPKNSEPITPSEMEQYEQALNDGLVEAQRVNIDANKVGNTATVTITNRNGTNKSVSIVDGANGDDGSDGVGLQYNWNGTSLGIKREDEVNYQYTNLKGDTGSAGQNGKDGKNGVDGFSPTITSSKSGKTTTITMTDKQGTTTATILDGNDGQDGQNGQDGYTPVKGVDYFTQQDIASLNIPSSLSQLSDDTTHRVVTDTEKTTWNGKQDTLVSGTSIKTINNESLLGSGNIAITGGGGNSVKFLGDIHDYSTQQDALNLNELEVGCYIITGVDSDFYLKATFLGQTVYGNYYIPDLALGMLMLVIYEQVSEDTEEGAQIGVFNYLETSYYSMYSLLAEIYIFQSGISMGGGISYDYPVLNTALGNLPVLGTNTTQVLKNIDGYIAWDDDGVSSALGGSY